MATIFFVVGALGLVVLLLSLFVGELGDLGLGHVVGELSPGVWGTDGFVAPEVVLGADPTPAADVYGLGALGWLCLTGAAPGPPGLRPPLADLSLAGPDAVPLVEALEARVRKVQGVKGVENLLHTPEAPAS